MLVSTTHSLEGFEIESYIGPVSSHVVAGTGLFSDVAASFSDIFGGRSKSYQKQLTAIKNEAISQLEEQARRKGANCILGLTLDHDEISGSGKSMFMVSALGTAVRLKALQVHAESLGSDSVAADDVLVEIKKIQMVNKAAADRMYFNNETWDFIIQHQVTEAESYVRSVLKRAADPQGVVREGVRQRAADYYYNLPREETKRCLYEMVLDDSKVLRRFAKDVIEVMDLLDLDQLKTLLQSEDFPRRERALQLLDVNYHPAYYVEEDVSLLRQIEDIVKSESFAPDVELFTKERTFSSKEDEWWRCECGQEMKIQYTVCSNCYRDIYGFLRNELNPKQAVAHINARLEALEQLFSRRVASAKDPR